MDGDPFRVVDGLILACYAVEAEQCFIESCGKCCPCQMGTVRQAEILRRVAGGQPRSADAATLVELGRVMTDTSICGLGQAASLAILDAQERWPDLFQPAQL